MKSKKRGPQILLPVDFSAHSKAALIKGCELAECMDATPVALHVIHDPADMPGYYGLVTKKKKLLRMEDLAREAFDEFMKGMVDEHPNIKKLQKVDKLLVVGLPVRRILEIVDKRNVLMVVMGSQGLTGIKHMMLGSKAEQVVRLCPVPVTIVKKKKG